MTTSPQLVLRLIFAVTACAALAGAADSAKWDARLAASYLDERAAWWAGWPKAARDRGTFCISCHTALPYALGRPALRPEAGESATEQRVLDNVRNRVRQWNEMEPVYNDARSGAGKSEQARATEAVLNALVLSAHDRRRGAFSQEARQALDHMLAQQLAEGDAAGSWVWLNFQLQPWEAADQQFWGATLAAMAIGNAPREYRAEPSVRDAVRRLAGYLRKHEATQPLAGRAGLLLAAVGLPGTLPSARRGAIVQEILARQQADGGWSSAALIDPAWKRKDESAAETASDGYGTAWIAYVLQASGQAPREAQRALAWLAAHQDRTTGQIPSASLNKKRDPASDAGRFMSDAATAYAALAFEGR